MKHTTFWLLIAVLTALCGTSWSATLILRNGKKLSGDVVSKTDEHVVLKTPAGLVTQQWRACTPATIKALHPALYNRLLKEAEARKKKHEEEMAAKGFAKVGDKWLPKDQALPLLLAKVRLGVVVSESVGKFERTDRGDGSIDKDYKRESRGVLRVKLDDLDPAQRYTLRTKFICYVDEPYSDNDRALTKDNERSESISGKHSAAFEYLTEPYLEFKEVLTRGWRFADGGRQRKADARIKGWDIQIWLNDTLIYSRSRTGAEEFHHVRKM